ILVEGTAPQAWVDLIFGMTKGWWKFDDVDLRRSHPLLSRNSWIDLLRSEGFVDPIGMPTGEAVLAQQTLVVARAQELRAAAVKNVASISSRDLSGTWVIVGEQGELAGQIAARITAGGGNPRRLDLTEPALGLTTCDELRGSSGVPVRGVV